MTAMFTYMRQTPGISSALRRSTAHLRSPVGLGATVTNDLCMMFVNASNPSKQCWLFATSRTSSVCIHEVHRKMILKKKKTKTVCKTTHKVKYESILKRTYPHLVKRFCWDSNRVPLRVETCTKPLHHHATLKTI